MPANGGGLKTKARIDLNRSGTAAHPQRLALNPATNILYVTDPLSDEVIAIDRGHNNEIIGRIAVGRLPRSIVFASNGEKAYVSNEGPVHAATSSQRPALFRHQRLDIVGICDGLRCRFHSTNGRLLWLQRRGIR